MKYPVVSWSRFVQIPLHFSFTLFSARIYGQIIVFSCKQICIMVTICSIPTMSVIRFVLPDGNDDALFATSFFDAF